MHPKCALTMTSLKNFRRVTKTLQTITASEQNAPSYAENNNLKNLL